jgi:phage tail sheath protein FI
MRALDLASDITLLAIPERATAAVQLGMYQYSEVVRNRSVVCIMDPPANSTATGIVTWWQTTAPLIGVTETAAGYWPRIKVLNPVADVYGIDQTLVVAPSGHLAGMFARNDAKRLGGVYNPPAGTEDGQLLGVVGLETNESLDESKRDYVFPKRINPITTLPGGGAYYVDGARTFKGNGNFPSVSERRGVSFIEQSIKQGLEFARHKNNDVKLRKTCERTVTIFLLTQMRNGAFRSTDPKKAFFVDFGEGLNPPSAQFAGKLYGRIGLATQKPAEYIILSFSQDTRALEEELLAAQR